MQLWCTPTSPFARKVRVAAHELGLDGRIELVRVDPWSDRRLRALNPLAKVPTLVCDDGAVLYESGVICDWLDARSPPRRLLPGEGEARWRALLLQGLADGACTAAGRLFADERRPETERSAAMMARFQAAIAAVLAELERVPPSDKDFRLGEICVAVFLGYLDFRWPERDWRAAAPALAAWFAEVDQRPSMRGSAHHA